jgi:hypothetical protein
MPMVDAAQNLDDPPTLYEHDFTLWCTRQAELLRLRRFDEADLPNIVEELEGMGSALRASLRSSYRLLAHLLTWQYQPAMRSASWEIAINRERDHIEDIEADNRSLKAAAAKFVAEAYRKTRKEAQVGTKLPLSTFPPQIPYTLDQLRDDEWLPA